MTAVQERTTGTAVIPTVRNADFQDLLRLLNEDQARKLDLVVPASQLKFREGMLVIAGQEMILEDDGFTDPNGEYWPTQVFDDHVAERLDIAPAYLRRLRHGKVNARGKQTAVPRLDLWDANVNGLLKGRRPKVREATRDELAESVRPDGTIEPWDQVAAQRGLQLDPASGRWWTYERETVAPDSRSFLLRLFRPDRGQGIARALLSNRFARMDNIDGLFAMLKGIQDAGIDPETLRIYGDISETRMFVHVAAPQILAAAPGLLDGYRSPFDTASERDKRKGKMLSLAERIELGRQFRERGHGDGFHNFYEAGNEPLVHAGFKLTNSEVGNGRWMIQPEITVLRCSNGLTMTKDGFARTHVGSKLDDGHIEWSADTTTKELAFVTAQTRDIVKAVLSERYLEEKVTELEAKAGKPVAEPEKVIEVVAKKLNFSKEEQDGILRHLFLGGQLTTGGVMHAVTSYSQTVDNPDAAHDLDTRAVEAMNLAYAAA